MWWWSKKPVIHPPPPPDTSEKDALIQDLERKNERLRVTTNMRSYDLHRALAERTLDLRAGRQ